MLQDTAQVAGRSRSCRTQQELQDAAGSCRMLQGVAINVIQFIMTLQKFFRALRAPLATLAGLITTPILLSARNGKLHYHYNS
jgi:hypothetical protein